ncbi:cysteine desulfurase family protein [Methanosphaerula palustris]|uniref:Aminotransferase class V n=1 Tax=Methanosphaerula palustris (strain ATCC BAA-1556 / DSM 19958 / E1-9c) TaxID=521011 RepID=B8GJE3_METPE|nr:cysteine desulfurase family protein [Methanosphaerula palustris]ACL16984.1 aminotransferase class V [Methanosphaerula palustris E1-9c]
MKQIYLDHASASPVDPRVVAFAVPFLSEDYGNPSTLYVKGLDARRALESARGKVASLINAESPATIIFTGSATESNNLAIRGTALRNRQAGQKVVSSVIEHISVLNPMKELQKSGYHYETVPVDASGIVDLETLADRVTKETVVTSINYANDEIGTIEPIREISEIVHERGQYLHVNATAAAGKISIDVQKDGVDLLTLSSNDLAGPRGAAALYIRRGVKVQTILPGGGQENGIRSGTENLFAIAGMGEAAVIAGEEMAAERERLQQIASLYRQEILTIPDSYLTGHPTERLPGHLSFRFSRIEGESILLNLDTAYNIQVATGSACSSRTLEPSHVLLAIGLKHEEAHGSMIMTLGRSTLGEDIPYVVDAVKKTVDRLREITAM